MGSFMCLQVTEGLAELSLSDQAPYMNWALVRTTGLTKLCSLCLVVQSVRLGVATTEKEKYAESLEF
jgi:hypothetical protein